MLGRKNKNKDSIHTQRAVSMMGETDTLNFNITWYKDNDTQILRRELICGS